MDFQAAVEGWIVRDWLVGWSIVGRSGGRAVSAIGSISRLSAKQSIGQLIFYFVGWMEQ